jgi:hypothetical protein
MLRDTKGVRDLASLLAAAHRELHVLDLGAQGIGPPAVDAESRSTLAASTASVRPVSPSSTTGHVSNTSVASKSCKRTSTTPTAAANRKPRPALNRSSTCKSNISPRLPASAATYADCQRADRLARPGQRCQVPVGLTHNLKRVELVGCPVSSRLLMTAASDPVIVGRWSVTKRSPSCRSSTSACWPGRPGLVLRANSGSSVNRPRGGRPADRPGRGQAGSTDHRHHRRRELHRRGY